MSSGRSHEIASLTTAVALTAVCFAGTREGWPLQTWMLPLGALSGTLFTPDLDYADKDIRPHNTVYHGFGGFVYLVWRAIWWVYGKVIPHRSFWSHFPFVGTFGRFMYIWPILFIIKVDPFALMGSSWFWMFFLGLAIVDILHWLMDGRPVKSPKVLKNKGERK